MQWRVLLAAVIVAGASLCGWAMTDAARQRARALRVLREDVCRLRAQMLGMFAPVQDGLALSASPLLRRVGEGMASGLSAGEAWRRLSRSPGCGAVLAREDREALDGLFSELGETGRERQDALLSGTADRLGELVAGASEQAKRAERLYGALGMLLGLLAALLVI